MYESRPVPFTIYGLNLGLKGTLLFLKTFPSIINFKNGFTSKNYISLAINLDEN